jgi:hypothetical protein
MERSFVGSLAALFLIFAAVGFSLGVPGDGGSDRFREEVSYTANASNPIEEITFDGRNMSLILQSATDADFYLNVNGTIEPLEGLSHDGEVHELRDFVTLDGKMYLLEMRYHDDSEDGGDEWITLYRVTGL